MEEKNRIFARKNLYLILAAIGLVAVLVAIIIAIATNSNTGEISNSTSQSSSQSTSQSKSDSSTSSSSQSTSKSDTQTDVEILFVMPVVNGYEINEYTAASVIFSKTLGIYTGHMGIDIAGEEGANVLAAYGGTVQSIETTYLQGTTVIIDHGDGLKTLYNSIEVLDDLHVGQVVEQGDVLGTISTNNRQEYKDGAHLHFEVYQNGKTIDPYLYLDVDGK